MSWYCQGHQEYTTHSLTSFYRLPAHSATQPLHSPHTLPSKARIAPGMEFSSWSSSQSISGTPMHLITLESMVMSAHFGWLGPKAMFLMVLGTFHLHRALTSGGVIRRIKTTQADSPHGDLRAMPRFVSIISITVRLYS